MSENVPSSKRPDSPGATVTLAHRLRDRVLHVTEVLERRDRRESRRTASATAPSGDASMSRELRALRVVYREMGKAHRRYRHGTGERVPVALRSAAKAFRQKPSLIALVPVAGFLDDLRLLKW